MDANERERFEAYARSRYKHVGNAFNKNEDGTYHYPPVREAYGYWQASLASAPRAAEACAVTAAYERGWEAGRRALDRIANSPRVQDFALSAEQMQGIARDAARKCTWGDAFGGCQGHPDDCGCAAPPEVVKHFAHPAQAAAADAPPDLGQRSPQHTSATALSVVDSWRTIDSAPRDGTVILGYLAGGSGGCYMAVGFDGDKWRDAGETWWAEPTHWMPLPKPPRTEDAKGQSDGQQADTTTEKAAPDTEAGLAAVAEHNRHAQRAVVCLDYCEGMPTADMKDTRLLTLLDTAQKFQRAYEASEQRCRGLEADARRYRFLRQESHWLDAAPIEFLDEVEMDASIDAAINSAKGKP